MSIFFDKKKKKTIEVIGIEDYKNESLRFTYFYNLNSKKIIIKKNEMIRVYDDPTKESYSTSDPKEIEKFMKKHKMTKEELVNKKKYFLYDKLLTDWFTYNPKSKFSLEDLGEIYVEEK
ncbi:TipC family immunity protein [Bacillus aquiflavi]|uniref:TipC family immunity protein n=1 Tax=Bacillus aquiflavi TaxID=2672567 RepID=UPI00223C5009|nr:TipC family immunity protein [Bacillus aquiflavi]